MDDRPQPGQAFMSALRPPMLRHAAAPNTRHMAGVTYPTAAEGHSAPTVSPAPGRRIA